MDAQPISPWFAWAGRQLAAAARRLDLVAPSFASPPSVPGVNRTMRRLPGSSGAPACAHVLVRLWGRSLEAIRADMIDGVLAANGLGGEGADAGEVRRCLLEVVPLPEQTRAA